MSQSDLTGLYAYKGTVQYLLPPLRIFTHIKLSPHISPLFFLLGTNLVPMSFAQGRKAFNIPKYAKK